ncbi:MAG: NAD(+) diphosphatase [Rhodospirillaceae bacterium]|nr:MAG: NAD(+) diphosphatase [Rhodospirillaceae bacterium]
MAPADADDTRKSTLAFTGDGIDRAGVLRADAAQMDALLKDKNARLVPVWQQRHLIAHAGDAGPRPRYLSFAEAEAHIDLTERPPVFLGMTDQTPWFAIGLPDGTQPPEINDGDFRSLLDVAALLPNQEATLLAYARGMLIWHENHRHCGRCGAAAAVTESGHSRTCTNDACKHRSFPRTDPVVITLVAHPDGTRCLLGRQAAWPKGFYSTVAGFVEPGETLEAAVAREVREETGITVTDARYMSSQPWPFPSSIMLGFRARATTTDIHCDDKELEDCRWFTREEVRAFGERVPGDAQPYKMPPPTAIARLLIDSWLNEK